MRRKRTERRVFVAAILLSLLVHGAVILVIRSAKPHRARESHVVHLVTRTVPIEIAPAPQPPRRERKTAARTPRARAPVAARTAPPTASPAPDTSASSATPSDDKAQPPADEEVTGTHGPR